VATASSGVPTVEEREGVKNRRRNLLSTLAATLIDAVVGSLGGAYLGVTVGANRDDERSNRKFLRRDRTALYGGFLTAVDESYSLVSRWIPPRRRDYRAQRIQGFSSSKRGGLAGD
jgi:hypothetical protein